MNIEQQKALLKLQNDGYIIHWNGGMHVSSVGKGRIFPVTQEWLDEHGKYLNGRPPEIGGLIYKDDTYTCVPLDRSQLYEFILYKKLDIEKMVAKYAPEFETEKV
jgi:hypothetical protein